MDRKDEVRGFFISRRERLTPADVGFDTPGQLRRVPGLRREEVAERAGISVEYYTLIERGNLEGVSDAVLHGLGYALQLNDSETAYLHQLARQSCSAEKIDLPTHATEGVQRVVESITTMPAFACNAQLDLLSINTLGSAIFLDNFSDENVHVVHPVNLARLCFTDPRRSQIYPNWSAVAEIVVSLLRFGQAHAESDRDRMNDFIATLSAESADFRDVWNAYDVTQRWAGSVDILHQDAGVLQLDFEQFLAAAQPGVTLHVLSAQPGSETFLRLQNLT